MRKIMVLGSGPTVGMDYCEALGVYSDDIPNDRILMEARDFAIDRISSYMEVLTDEPEEEGWEHYVDYCYEEDMDYWIEDYDSEIHDMQKGGGGSFKEIFDDMVCC